MQSYPFYVACWRGSESVKAMTLEAQGLYRNLLDYAWERGSLPADQRSLQQIGMASDAEWERQWPTVSKQFEERDGRLWNNKVDERRPFIVDAKAERAAGVQLNHRLGGLARSETAKRDANGKFLPNPEGKKKEVSEAEANGSPANHQQSSLASYRINVLAGDPAASVQLADSPAPKPMQRATTETHQEARQAVNAPWTPPNPTEVLRSFPRAGEPRRARHSEDQSNPPPAELVDQFTNWGYDADIPARLWLACRGRDAKCTPDEIVAMYKATKDRWWRKENVKNPTGLMLTVVPLEFGSGRTAALSKYRNGQ